MKIIVLAFAVVLVGAAPQDVTQQVEQQQQQQQEATFEQHQEQTFEQHEEQTFEQHQEQTFEQQQQQQQQEVVVEEVVLETVEKRPIEILVDERVQPENGVYSFQVETENGIVHSEQGVAGSRGQTNVQGIYRFVQDNGEVAEVRYTADEYGFQPESDLLPVAPEFPHPIPQYVLNQIAFGEEQRRLQALSQQQQEQQVEIQQEEFQVPVQEEVQQQQEEQLQVPVEAEQQEAQQEEQPAE